MRRIIALTVGLAAGVALQFSSTAHAAELPPPPGPFQMMTPPLQAQSTAPRGWMWNQKVPYWMSAQPQQRTQQLLPVAPTDLRQQATPAPQNPIYQLAFVPGRGWVPVIVNGPAFQSGGMRANTGFQGGMGFGATGYGTAQSGALSGFQGGYPRATYAPFGFGYPPAYAPRPGTVFPRGGQ